MTRETAVSIVTRWGQSVSVCPGDLVQLAGLPRAWFKVLHIAPALPTRPSQRIDLADEHGREFSSVVSAIVDARHPG
jgi:hypothetical protein